MKSKNKFLMNYTLYKTLSIYSYLGFTLIEPLGFSGVIRPEGWRELISRRKKIISKNNAVDTGQGSWAGFHGFGYFYSGITVSLHIIC